VGRENIFKQKIRMRIYIGIVFGVKIVNFVTSKYLFIKSTMFLHQNNHKYTWTFPHGKTVNQTDHILIDRRWQLSIPDVRSVREQIAIPNTLWWLQN
jgi:hypothetical protein